MADRMSGNGSIDNSVLKELRGISEGLNNIRTEYVDTRKEFKKEIEAKVNDKSIKEGTKTIKELREEWLKTAESTQRSAAELWDTKTIQKKVNSTVRDLDKLYDEFNNPDIKKGKGFETRFIKSFETLKAYSDYFGKDLTEKYKPIMDNLFTSLSTQKKQLEGLSDIKSSTELDKVSEHLEELNQKMEKYRSLAKESFEDNINYAVYDANDNYVAKLEEQYKAEKAMIKKSSQENAEAMRQKKDMMQKEIEAYKNSIQEALSNLIAPLNADEYFDISEDDFAELQKIFGNITKFFNEYNIDTKTLDDKISEFRDKVYPNKDALKNHKSTSGDAEKLNAEPEMPEINTNTKSLKELVELYHQLGTSGGAKEELDKISDSILEIVQAENKLDPGQMQQFVEVLRGLTFVDGDNPISKIPYTVEEAISAFEKLSKAKQTLNESSLSEGKDSGVKEAEAVVDKSEKAVEKVKEVSAENEKATEKTKELNESFEKGGQISKEAINNEESSLSNLKATLEDVVSRVDAKTRAFQEEGMIVDSVVQEEITKLEILGDTLRNLLSDINIVADSFKSIKIDNTQFDNTDTLRKQLNDLVDGNFWSAIENIDLGFKILQDTINGLSIKDNSFFDGLNKLLEDGEKLKNLAKVLSASEKRIKAASREVVKKKKKKEDEYDEKVAIKNESIVEGKIKAKLKELENVENVSVKRALDSHGHLIDAIITAEEKRFNEQTQKWEAVVNKYNIKPELSSVESDVDYTKYNEKRLNEETKINNRIAKDSENKINSIKEKAEGFHTVLQNLFNSGKYTKDFNDYISETKSKIEALFEAIKNGKGIDELSDAFNDIKKDFDKINFKKSLGENIQSADVQIEKLRKNLLALKNDFPNMKGDELIRFNSLDKLISDFKEMKNVSRDALSATMSDILKLRNDLEDAGNAGKGFWDKVRNRSSDMSAKFIGQYLSLQDIVRYTREAVNTIRELDTQLVDLRKTTTMSEFDLNEFYLASNDIAKSMGVTTSQIIEQASAWSRLGYSTKEASETMATLSSQFASISPGTTVENATDYLVSAMQAFGISTDEVERKLMDNINAIGNSMATTNGEIGEMLLRSSAAMKAANNSIEETIALESAAVQITRNAETTGTAFRTKDCPCV